MSKPIRRINKKKKFVADGVFHAELHCFLSKSLVTAGYAGIEIRKTPLKIEIRLKATKPQDVYGVEGRKIRELQFLIQKRFGYDPEQLVLQVQKVNARGICASAQAESLKFKLLSNIPVRLAANSIIKAVMKGNDRSDNTMGARGCEIIISGKLQQQRAKTMKFRQGYMISSGQPRLDFVDESVRHVFFKQGIMGVKVKIMLPHDPTGKNGPKTQIPDHVEIMDPKKEDQETAREQELRNPLQSNANDVAM